MQSWNSIQIGGYLGRDPELRYLADGTAVADFSVGTSNRRKRDGEETTTWFKVTFFGRQAETVSQYLHKGDPVFVEGTLEQRAYSDRDGNPRTSLEVKGSAFRFLANKNGTAKATQAAPASAPSAHGAPPEDEFSDLGDEDPF